MKQQPGNFFLSKIMNQIHDGRPKLSSDIPFYNRVEKSNRGNYVEVWFLTSGCRWDIHGGCTMCNYGQGPERTENEIVEAVSQGLFDITVKADELVVSPSGSFLDVREVPLNARNRIYSLIKDFPATKFVFETRPETVTEKTVKELVQSIPNKKIGVEIGLESSNFWIQRFCVNKGIYPDQFRKAAGILTKYGIEVYTNISLGIPFLNSHEAINDAANSIRWAFANGANTCVLFPIHIKPYTLLAWLTKKGLYRQPSLWSLVEVLYLIGDELMDRTEISWYRNYYTDKSKVIASPTTCPECYDEVIKGLDEYRNSRSSEVIKQLRNIDCSCQNVWKAELIENNNSPLPKRVLDIYKELADEFYPTGWWNINGHKLQHLLTENYNKII